MLDTDRSYKDPVLEEPQYFGGFGLFPPQDQCLILFLHFTEQTPLPPHTLYFLLRWVHYIINVIFICYKGETVSVLPPTQGLHQLGLVFHLVFQGAVFLEALCTLEAMGKRAIRSWASPRPDLQVTDPHAHMAYLSHMPQSYLLVCSSQMPSPPPSLVPHV